MKRKVKIKIEEISDGQLERDIYDDKGQLLLSKGSLLTSQTVNSLKRRQIDEVYIMIEESDLNLAPDPQEKCQDRNEIKSGIVPIVEVYNEALHFVEGFMSDIRQKRHMNIGAVEKTVNIFTENMTSDDDLVKQLRRIKDKDAYLYTHSVNVSLLSIMIGRWLELDDQTINRLGVAGMLHDIGKVHIPDAILNKPAALTAQEFEIIKNHSVYGYRVLQEQPEVDQQIMYAVLMHHERMDGSGYPSGVGFGKIPNLASVIAIADTFDAITSKRVYSEKRTPYMAADIIMKESLAGKVDPRISKVFYDHILSLSVNDKVLLSNRQLGEVVLINPLKPAFPVVKVEEHLYYLDREPDLTIVEVL